MTFIVTSKTRRSPSWREGSKAKVMDQLKEVERRNNEKAEECQDRHVKKVLDNFDGWS